MASSHKNSINENEKHHIDILDLNKEMTEDLEEAIEWEDDEVDDEEARFELSLAGKIWTNRNINASVFISIMKNVWQPKHGIEITNIGKNLFMFQFHHWKDKQYVLNEQP